jgi:hypothetical protein
MSITLAGVPVPDRDVLELTRRLRASGFLDTAEALELAYDSERRVVSLSVPDREAIMRTLEDCPDELGGCAGFCSGSTTGAWSTGSESCPIHAPNVRKRA